MARAGRVGWTRVDEDRPRGLTGPEELYFFSDGNKDNLFCFSDEIIYPLTSLRTLIKFFKSYILFSCMGVEILF